MSTLRVLQCIASLHEAAAGTTVYFDRLISALPQVGIDPLVMATGIPAPTIPGHYFATDPNPIGAIAAMRPSRALRAALIDEACRVDVVHTHGLWLLPNVYPGKAARTAGIPLVVSPHGMLGRGALQFSAWKKRLFWAALQRRGVADAACWHVTSEKGAEDVRAFGIRAPIAIVPIGIDLPPVLADCAERRRDVLFLGRLHPKKGLDSLLRVWPAVVAQAPEWTLRIVGPRDAAAERYRQQAAGIAGVRFDEPAFGDAKWDCYRRSALFVLPTRDENFGITVAEALAAETPVICSDGAPWQGLETHNAGWWIGQSDDALAAALHTAIALPEASRRAMGARGQAWMGRDFAWDAIVPQMAALYAWLAKRGDRPDFVHS